MPVLQQDLADESDAVASIYPSIQRSSQQHRPPASQPEPAGARSAAPSLSSCGAHSLLTAAEAKGV
tara:strand:+ start:288 stop:485 length:198 start_codon:yes stop_codon:yes gene_type:complete